MIYVDRPATGHAIYGKSPRKPDNLIAHNIMLQCSARWSGVRTANAPIPSHLQFAFAFSRYPLKSCVAFSIFHISHHPCRVTIYIYITTTRT